MEISGLQYLYVPSPGVMWSEVHLEVRKVLSSSFQGCRLHRKSGFWRVCQCHGVPHTWPCVWSFQWRYVPFIGEGGLHWRLHVLPTSGHLGSLLCGIGHFSDSQPAWCFCLFGHSTHWSWLERRWIDQRMQVSSWRWVRSETPGLEGHLTTRFQKFGQTHGIGVELCQFWWHVFMSFLWESLDVEDGVAGMSGTRNDVGPCVMMHWSQWLVCPSHCHFARIRSKCGCSGLHLISMYSTKGAKLLQWYWCFEMDVSL